METSILDFQQAKLKHLQFKSRLRAILFGEVLEDESPVLSHFECPVGKWIYGHALNEYGHIAQVHQLEAVHEQIHTVARGLIKQYKEGKITESRSGLEEMENIADELIGLLEEVENKLTKTNAVLSAEPDIPEIKEGVATLTELYENNKALYAKIQVQSDAFSHQEQFYKNLLSASPVILWRSDENAGITYMSPTWYQWTGLAEDAVLGEKWVDTIHTEDREMVVNKYAEKFAAREKFEMEYRMDLGEKITWCLATGQPSYDIDQRFTGYVGSVTDITQRKFIEDKINRKRENERKILGDFFMEAPAIFSILRGPEHVFEMANPQYIELIGNRDVIGMRLKDALPEVEEQGFIEILDNVYRNKEKYIGTEIPIVLHKEQGPEEVFVTFVYQPILNNKKESEGILVYANDVTEQVKARKILEKSEEHFKLLADMSPQIIWTARPDGFVDYYNLRWYEFTGSVNAFGDESWQRILHPDDVHRATESWYKSVKNGGTFSNEFRFVCGAAKEYRWFLCRAIPQLNEENKIIRWFGSCTDIHEQKNFTQELEKKVQERTQQLVDVNMDLKRSNEELSQFAYVASHDLQEPLRKIITFSNRIEEKFSSELSEGVQAYLQKINNSANRMTLLINDLLDFSGSGRHVEAFKPTDLNAIIRNISEDFEVEIKQKNAVIKVDSLPVISAIPLQMTQLFHNLLSNALKFAATDKTPSITVSAHEIPEFEKNSYRLSDASQKYIRIQFCDNGIGFDQKFSEKIFTIFQRLHDRSAYEGTGIGLALCKKITENHGGTIYAESKENQGACFNIILPVHNTKQY